MTDTKTTSMQTLMGRATDTIGPAAILALAAEMTKPKTTWKGRRKLSRDEALAATRAVTAMLVRYRLQPTRVLVGAGRASVPAATGRFYLTGEEMRPSAKVTKRLATGVGAHLDHVRAVARHAREAGHEVDENALLGELADAVGTFLEQFRGEPELDPDEELARDVDRVAAYLASPRRGFEFARFLAEARRRDLVFDEGAGEMAFHGEGASLHEGNTPVVPLLTRTVAHAVAEVFRVEWDEDAGADGDVLFHANPKRTSLGRTHCVVCEEVGLGVVADPDGRGGLRMVFTLDPVTYVGEPGEGADGEHWHTLGYRRFLRIASYPNPGDHARLGEDGHWFTPSDPDSYECAEFRSFYGRLLVEMEPGDEERLWSRRLLPVTAGTVGLLLPEHERTASDVWRTFAGIPDRGVLPSEVEYEAGVASRTIRDRFAGLLYAEDDGALSVLLEAAVRRRTEALEGFLLRSATGLRRRKLAFRARMRR